MPTRPRTPRSVLALVLLAATLTIGPAGIAHARPGHALVVSRGPSGAGAVEAAVLGTGPAPSSGAASFDGSAGLRSEHLRPRLATRATEAWTARPTTDTPVPAARSEAATSASPGSGPASFSGRNRVWIPSLGIRQSVRAFACSSTAYPGDRVYRWGCAGKHNIYLFGHAHGIFKPLHDAYVRGNLAKGMRVYFADGAGTVATYTVSWWKVTTPDKGAFAYAAQSRPSMTLQTCVGADSQYRLIVRLAKAS